MIMMSKFVQDVLDYGNISINIVKDKFLFISHYLEGSKNSISKNNCASSILYFGILKQTTIYFSHSIKSGVPRIPHSRTNTIQ